MCSWRWLVDAAPALLRAAEAVPGGSTLAHWIVRESFFAHFCGGESVEDVGAAMDAMRRAGLGAILDISIEADLGHGSGNSETDLAAADAAADRAAAMFTASVDAAGNHPGACIAVKVTALGPPAALRSVSGAIARAIRLLDAAGPDGMSRAAWTAAYPGPAAAALYTAVEAASGKRETATTAGLITILSRDPTAHLAALGLEPADAHAFEHLVSRLHDLCAHAATRGVGLMVDAEQTYFQDAIDVAALAMSRQFNGSNGGKPVVFNTYQQYLKDALPRLERDLAVSEREGWHFAAKLVRGAYMVSERAKADREGYSSPIHDSIQDTHAAYDAAVDRMLARIRAQAAGQVKAGATAMVATHNRGSVVRTVREMAGTADAPAVPHERVMFGQLMGMHDLTGYALANNGFRIYKYLPYGPVGEVIPYLLRRAQENSGMLGGANFDKQLLWHELVCRVQETKAVVA
ncbi:FAD-linked oxidoreductase-like protein [Blastocladiella britannica]|nr:FAD-linked oxidoreductase-like protein [Blastocladiella britannica]